MNEPMNVDENEIGKFDRVANIWWDPQGEMGTLHTINPLRVEFILKPLASPAPVLLDVGCGGGILCEALAERGAHVIGIDLSLASLQVARQHAQQRGLQIDYRLEKLPTEWKIFDVNVLGVWLVDQYKSSFAQQIAASGVDGLINALVAKNKAPAAAK